MQYLFQSIFRYGLFPVMFFGANALGIALVANETPVWQRIMILIGAVGLMLLAERSLPYDTIWNRNHQDVARDVLHALVNTSFNYIGVWLLPSVAVLGVFSQFWPAAWPFWGQVIFAILILDAGVTLTHYFSHRIELLWRFHAVHHSVKRLYGFNGLMKHPVHQAIETTVGIAPLVLLGIPATVASAVVFAVALQLLLQHSNVNYRTGPLKYVFATAEVHRFHHRKGAGLGDVNFGLFTMLWDHMLGSYHYTAGRVGTSALGIGDQPDYPSDYVRQLLEPFWTSEAADVTKPA